MIVYRNERRIFLKSGKNYDETYRRESHRFTHRATFEVLDEILEAQVPDGKRFWALDLGCGQGQVLDHVRETLDQNASPPSGDLPLYGIDISEVAITQCENRYPRLRWIVDSFQDFLQRPETPAEYFGRFDLVINLSLIHI